MKKILLLLIAYMFVVSFADSTKIAEVNVWRKVSTDELNPGAIVPLDMSQGYASCAGEVLYIVVHAVGSEEDIVIVFPNGGYWTSPEPDPFLQELQKEFDNLEHYLRNKESEEIKKK